MNILITGSEGFIGKNLFLYFSEKEEYKLNLASRSTSQSELDSFIDKADCIFHLAGVNRPKDEKEFFEGNVDTTKYIVEMLLKKAKKVPIFFSSSIQYDMDNAYGRSKKKAEEILLEYQLKSGGSVYIFRFPNVFGKFAKPNYNSVVATFCFNIARSLPIEIHDPQRILNLVFIEDVCKSFEKVLKNNDSVKSNFPSIEHQYSISLGELANTIKEFKESRNTLLTGQVGTGFLRALYSTYVSYIPIKDCHYSIPEYRDNRGRFTEMLKTKSSGQFSFFSASPGVTRGKHYHNTKTEKFLVLQGKALFKFQHTITKEYYEVLIEGMHPTILDTIPGWTHDITNVGEEELLVMLWANEVFDRMEPDTFFSEIQQ